jgi:hypothetical protein
MAKPVKTLVMDAIEAAIKSLAHVPNADQVKRGQGIPIDLDTAVYPWTCFFDEPEAKKEKNRISIKTFELVVQTWVKKSTITIDEQMDTIDADLEKKLLNDSGIADACIRIEAKGSEKFILDDMETGILQSTYELTYAHKWKDPYDPAKGS